jgi:carboxymethylenebutenolidase
MNQVGRAITPVASRLTVRKPAVLGVDSLGSLKEQGMTQSQTKRAAATGENLEQVWKDHLAGEFINKDVEATLATMTEDAFVNHVPVNTGGRGKDELRVFYRDNFIPSWPEDLQMMPVSRVVGGGQLVDELHVTFTHRKPMNWFLPNVPPTNQSVEIDIVVVAKFGGDKLACERFFWEKATVLRQVGLLPK